MEISNTIDPVKLHMLHAMAERASSILREIAGKDADSITFPIRWSTPDFHPAVEPAASRLPLILTADNEPGGVDFHIQILPDDFRDADWLRYKLLRFWAGCLRMKSENQMLRLDQLVKSLDGE